MGSAEALVFDAIRTPRGKGKVNGSLPRHQAGRPRRRPDARDARPQREARSRTAIDDVVLGCVSPGRRPGRRHRQDRGDQGRPARHRRRRPAQPLLRLRPRGRQHRRPEGRAPAGRTSSSPAASSRCRACRWAPTAAPGRWTRRRTTTRRFVPQGIGADLIATIEGFSRDDVDAYAARSQERAAEGAGRGPLRELRRPGQGPQRAGRPRQRRVHPRRHDRRDARRPEAVVRRDGRDGRLRRRRAAEVPLGREDRPRPHAGQLLGHRRRRLAAGDRQRGGRAASSASTPRARIVATAALRRRPDDHAHRPRARPAARRSRRPASPPTTSTSSRSTRRSRPSCCASSATWASTWRRSTSTAARSPWATRSARPAAMILGTLIDELSAPAAATASRRSASAAAWASPPSSSAI